MKDQKFNTKKLGIVGGIAALLGIATLALIKSNDKYAEETDELTSTIEGDYEETYENSEAED